MLRELIISEFAIVQHLHLRFDDGFTVLTGETGAGKSIIIDAVNLLLGERADSDMVRSGAAAGRVEGIFEFDPAGRSALARIIEEEALEGDQPGSLLMGREVRREGRHICRVNGRVVPLNVYRSISEHLIDIHGQGDHMSLLRVKEHQGFLDRFGGLGEQRGRMADTVRRLRQAQRELRKLRQDERERVRRIDLLQYQAEEIRSSQLQVGEDDDLKAERNRLANAEHLVSLTQEAYRAVGEGAEEQLCALDLLATAVRSLSAVERIDPTMADAHRQAEDLQYQLEELTRVLRDYADDIEYNPARLAQVEERLDLIGNLKRKYGDSIEDILRFGQSAAAELETIAHSAEREEALQTEEQGLLREAGGLAGELSARRRAAGERLSTEIERELADLQMERTRFQVEITHESDPQGLPADGGPLAYDETGCDRVEFLIAANPGEPLRPLAKTASGGEAARLMLALKVVLSHVDPVPTLIFDEIDQGIGGRTGGVVGHKLWSLTAGHQVLCVTHLPQIAAFADAHYRVSKHVVDDRTSSRVEMLPGDDRIVELAQMLGSDSESALRSAREMRDQVVAVKQSARMLPPFAPAEL